MFAANPTPTRNSPPVVCPAFQNTIRPSRQALNPLESALPRNPVSCFVSPIESIRKSQNSPICAKGVRVNALSATLTNTAPCKPSRMNTSGKHHQAPTLLPLLTILHSISYVTSAPQRSLRNALLNTRIRRDPHQRHEGVHGKRDPRSYERQSNRDGVKHQRDFSLVIAAERDRQRGLFSMQRNQLARQNQVSDTGQQQHRAIQRYRDG